MELKDIFIGRARKYNHFQDSEEVNTSHSCATCVRRQMSYPHTCNDGWPMGDRSWTDRGAHCLNWTDDGGAPVD